MCKQWWRGCSPHWDINMQKKMRWKLIFRDQPWSNSLSLTHVHAHTNTYYTHKFCSITQCTTIVGQKVNMRGDVVLWRVRPSNTNMFKVGWALRFCTQPASFSSHACCRSFQRRAHHIHSEGHLAKKQFGSRYFCTINIRTKCSAVSTYYPSFLYDVTTLLDLSEPRNTSAI